MEKLKQLLANFEIKKFPPNSRSIMISNTSLAMLHSEILASVMVVVNTEGKPSTRIFNNMKVNLEKLKEASSSLEGEIREFTKELYDLLKLAIENVTLTA
jgi:hypothetical protein